MATFTFTVGATGRTYPTLQAAWNALPATVPAGDTYFLTMAAGLYTAGLDCTASAKTVSGKVIIAPEAGAEWWLLFAAANAPLRYDNSKGVAIEASPFLLPTLNLQANVAARGIQVKGGGNKGAVSYENATATSVGIEVSNCIIPSDSTNPYSIVTQAASGDIYNNTITTTATSPPLRIADTNGLVINFVGNTVVKPDGGGGAWHSGMYGNGLRVVDNAIFGFSGSDAARIDTTNSFNNATDTVTFPGSANITSLSAASNFVGATAASTNLLLKAGTALTAAGVTNSLISKDAYGGTRSSPPSIGAVAYGSGASVATVPDAPAIGAATVASATSVSVAGTAPSNNDGAAIDLYRATASPSGVVATSATLPVLVTGLATGTAQTFRLEAHNSVGYSSQSAASNSATPVAGNAVPVFGGTIANISGTAGTAITPVDVSTLFTDSGDTKEYSASPSGTAWPTGITINASTGIISGTPTTAATTTGCKVRDTDSASQTVDSNTFNFVVAAASTKTWTCMTKFKNVSGAPQASLPCHAIIEQLDGTFVATKAGLTTGADGSLAPFTTTAGTLVQHQVMLVSDSNPLVRGYEIVTPT